MLGPTALTVLPSAKAPQTPRPSVSPTTVTPTALRPSPVAPVRPLAARRRPDILVTGSRTFSARAVSSLSRLAATDGSVAFRAGRVQVRGQSVRAVGVDPSAFRPFAAEGTAEADAVWTAVARGEAVTAHGLAKNLKLPLGGELPVLRGNGQATAPPVLAAATPSPPVEPAAPTPAEEPLRIGAFATVGVPGTELVLDDETAGRLGLPAITGMLLTAPEGTDPAALAHQVRKVAGDGAQVDLLTATAADPTAFLTGGAAAKAFGAFSYRYFSDGTIAPDAGWVSDNIRTEDVPILGRVTCHRLMLPQLRGALTDIVAAGKADTLTTYDGCYVPRFIERNPQRSVSLHTWGIAIDMDASTNYRGITGTMDPEVVAIFKRWGFRWGGDWAYTDPMHFELGALRESPG